LLTNTFKTKTTTPANLFLRVLWLRYLNYIFLKIAIFSLTDLLTIEKDLGRTLRGKKMAVITSSAECNMGEDFWIPFKASADYLGMPYIANLHSTEGEDDTARLAAFIKEIQIKQDR